MECPRRTTWMFCELKESFSFSGAGHQRKNFSKARKLWPRDQFLVDWVFSWSWLWLWCLGLGFGFGFGLAPSAEFPSSPCFRVQYAGAEILAGGCCRCRFFGLGSLALQLFSMYLDRPTSKDTSGVYLWVRVALCVLVLTAGVRIIAQVGVLKINWISRSKESNRILYY